MLSPSYFHFFHKIFLVPHLLINKHSAHNLTSDHSSTQETRDRKRNRHMGNCQAIDNANLLIQNPSGKLTDKLYHPVTAAEIMKIKPGYYVALLLTTTAFSPSTTSAKSESSQESNKNDTVRVTRIKLLRPTDMLVLGQVYRLVTNQEVMKGLSAKKLAKMKKRQEHGNSDNGSAPTKSDMEKNKQVLKAEKHGPNTTKPASTGASAKSRPWKPCLKSISESTS